MKYWTIILFLILPSWGFMQECPPTDTVAVTPAQNIYSFPYLNNWEEIEVMTWNIKEFPLSTSTTENYVNEIISDVLPDIICIQEINNESTYNSLAASLPAYSFISTNYSGSNPDLGMAVRNDCGEIISNTTLFPSDGDAFAWRYPLKADIEWHCGTSFLNFEVINVHFKAYDEGFEQRLEASEILSDYIDSNPNVNLVVAGDYNDEIDDPQSSNSFWPLISNENAYFVTTPIAGNSYYNSYPWGSYAGFIDHILISSSLFGQNASGNIATIRLDDFMGSTTYQNNISDHRPVMWSIPVEEIELNTGLVINEIMQNPAAVSDAAGEWIEITNISDDDISLNGLILKDNGGEQHVISDNSLIVAPEGNLVLGTNDDFSQNGGVIVDYEYSGFTLSNLLDEVILAHPSGEILDEVYYDNGATFPDQPGRSMMLLSPVLDNSFGENWAAADITFGSGDYGTPGEANYPCAYSPGDMNVDDTWNVLDIVILANCVLATNCADLANDCAADMNGDGAWNVLDIVTLVNCILVNNCSDL